MASLKTVAAEEIAPPPDAADVTACDRSTEAPDQGIAACSRLIDSKPAGLNLASVLNNRGNAWRIKQRYEDAVSDFTQSLQRDPGQALVFRNRGLTFYFMGSYERSVDDFNAAIKINPSVAEYYFRRGLALSALDEDLIAIDDFTKALTLDPQYTYAYIERAKSNQALNKLELVPKDLDKAKKISATDPVVFVSSASIWIDQGEFDRALQDLQRASDLTPREWRPYSFRANAYRLKGDFAAATQNIDKALEIDSDTSDIWLTRGWIYWSMGDYERAIQAASKAILLDSGSAAAFALRGIALQADHNLSRAQSDFDKAIALVPNASVFLGWRGQLFIETGDLDRAAADFAAVLKKNPNNPTALGGRGRISQIKGDNAKARLDFQRGLAAPDKVDFEQTAIAKKKIRQWLDEMKLAERSTTSASGDTKPVEKSPTPEAPPAERPISLGVRVALVIGNSEYRNVPMLPNPRRDAEAVGATLKQIGFQNVTVKTDLSRSDFVKALREFTDAASKADWAIIYYAGHGLSVSGINYLVPIDAQLHSDRDVVDEAISLERLLSATEAAKSLHIVILDACRDNPFRIQSASRAVSRGLTRVEPDTGTLVSYATADGMTAQDGNGNHSPYTEAFLRNVIKPKMEVDMLFRTIRADVSRTTKKSQMPFTYGSLPEQPFYFVP